MLVAVVGVRVLDVVVEVTVASIGVVAVQGLLES
jgi:hypothetical protein